MKIYIAGSISGKDVSEVFIYFMEYRKLLKSWGYTVLNPMTAKGHLRTEKIFKAKDYRHPISTNRAIIGRDRWMVGQADIVFVDLADAEHVSIGSVMEIAWAYELRKHIVVVIPENNIHQHGMLLQAADIVFEKTEDALNYLKALADDALIEDVCNGEESEGK